MIDKKDSAIIDAIMAAITQADTWVDILTNDPGIVRAEKRFDKALEAAKPYLPRPIYMELSDAYGNGISAYGDAGILYGMHVAMVLREGK